MTPKKWTTCSRCSRASGLTLIEVVAAIAILGTLLVGIVLAKARHTRQLALAEEKRDIVDAADELIAGWWRAGAAVPIDQAGTIDTDPPLQWQTTLVPHETLDDLGTRLVRVFVYEPGADLNAGEDGQPLVIVDLVLNEPRERQADRGPEALDEADTANRWGSQRGIRRAQQMRREERQ